MAWKPKTKLSASSSEVPSAPAVAGRGFHSFERLSERSGRFLPFLKGRDFSFFIGFTYFLDTPVN